ncbi:MAG: CdaR family protein [Ignavibacteriae bacterium]|nr:CdaR family protein [Ignavibacteriota bacterium]
MKRNIFILINTFIFSVLIWAYVNLNLTYTIESSIPLQIKSGKSQGVSNEIPNNLDVVLKGKGWGLMKVLISKNLIYYLDLTAFKKDTKIDLMQGVGDIINLPSDVYVQSINPNFIDVSFDNTISRMIKVKNNTSVQTRERYTVIGGVKISPDSVRVSGASSIVMKIKYVQTESIVFKDVNTNISRDVKLIDSLGNQVKIDPLVVNVSYRLELSAEKTFEDIDVNVYGVPIDKDVLIVPPKISISLRGGVEELSKLTSKDIKIGINFKQIESDEQGEVEPTIELSDVFTLIKVEPQRFQYIIKKKQQEN